MKISYEWLREYVNTKIRADNMASVLTMAGHEVTSTEQKGKDFIFDIEITPNRPDCLCHIGIAREVSAATGKPLKLPSPVVAQKSKAEPIKVSIKDNLACPHYSGRIITEVKVSQSSKWLIKKLEAVGLRPVNNIVDITNFVLFETGQPLHAFDLDKMGGREVVVRRAGKGEKIITIDGIERMLSPEVLIIADKERPVAIAGLMGGKKTEVTESTKNILLESAYFDPAVVRRGCRLLGMGSDSSYRFERGVDVSNIIPASERATELICDIAKARAGAITDVGTGKRERRRLTLRAKRLNSILGSNIKAGDIKDILLRLGFSCKGTTTMEVMPPTFRNDITREADLIEEAARIYGYDKIPLEAPSMITTGEESAHKDFMEKRKVAKDSLASMGFYEIITYSLVSREMIKAAGLSEEGVIGIMNPLSKEQEVMRRSLMPGIIKTISYNIGRQAQAIDIFELSNIYFIKEGAYYEEPSLGIGTYNKAQRKGASAYPYSGIFKLKGVVLTLAERLGITRPVFEKTSHPALEQDEALAVLSGNLMLGTVGRIKPEVLGAFDIKEEVFVAELNFNTIAPSSNLKRFYRPLARFPYSYRDISFSIDENILYKDIMDVIETSGSLLVEDVELLSEYKGKQIPPGQRALAFRIRYRAKDRTLTEDEINSADRSIRDNLTRAFAVSLR